MIDVNPMAQRLRISGTFLVIGLLIEAICLFSEKPIAFVLFVAVGGVFLFAGVTVFLFSLVSAPPHG
jgi:hypothetical protein